MINYQTMKGTEFPFIVRIFVVRREAVSAFYAS
jgi:hypothetical protein